MKLVCGHCRWKCSSNTEVCLSILFSRSSRAICGLLHHNTNIYHCAVNDRTPNSYFSKTEGGIYEYLRRGISLTYAKTYLKICWGNSRYQTPRRDKEWSQSTNVRRFKTGPSHGIRTKSCLYTGKKRPFDKVPIHITRSLENKRTPNPN